jgi:hypothetical protein
LAAKAHAKEDAARKPKLQAPKGVPKPAHKPAHGGYKSGWDEWRAKGGGKK